MGMDEWGPNPSQPEGKYFRANIWSWRPIHSLMVELCDDLLHQDTLVRMAVNVGAGPTDGETCRVMPDRFAAWMEHHTSGHTVDLGLRVASDGRFVSPDEVAANPSIETTTPYQVDDEHLAEWVAFLRHCGGFEVAELAGGANLPVYVHS